MKKPHTFAPPGCCQFEAWWFNSIQLLNSTITDTFAPLALGLLSTRHFRLGVSQEEKEETKAVEACGGALISITASLTQSL
jgi:hypothetical protein